MTESLPAATAHDVSAATVSLEISGGARVAVSPGAGAESKSGSRIEIKDRRAAALLALLAVEGNGWAHRIGRFLWPGLVDDQLRQRINSVRNELRTACGMDLVLGDELLHLSTGLQRQIGLCEAQLDALSRHASAPLLLDEHRYADLPEFSQWLGTMRPRLQRLARAYHSDQADQQERLGNLESALISAQRGLAIDRRSEESLHTVMRLLAITGRPAEALGTFAHCDALMQSRHGTGLSTDTRALADAIASGKFPAPRKSGAPGTSTTPRPQS